MRHVHAIGLQRHARARKLAAPLHGRHLVAAHQQASRRHRPGHAHAQGHAPGHALPGHRRPRRPVRRVLDLAHDRARLILQHRIQDARHARAPILALPLRSGQPPPIRRGTRLLTGQLHDLGGTHLRMHLAQRRDRARRHRGSHRRVPSDPGLAAQPGRPRREHVLAGRRESNIRETPVRRPRVLERPRARVSLVHQAQRRHGQRVRHHRGNHDAAERVTLERRPRVNRRGCIRLRRIIQIDTTGPGIHHVNDVLRRRVVDASAHRLQARGLLRVARHPVLPRRDQVVARRHGNPMIRRPHETAHDVLRVILPCGRRRHVDRRDVQRRIHARHAAGLARAGNHPGRLRADLRATRAPRLRIPIRHAVRVTGHGQGMVNLPRQVPDRVIHAITHDAHRHRRAHNIHALRVEGTHRLQVPVLRIRRGRVNTAHVGALRHRRLLLNTRVGGRLKLLGHDGLVAHDGSLTGRTHRVEGNAGIRQRVPQVHREGSRRGLDEERAQRRVGLQHHSAQQRGLVEGALERGVIRVGGQVHRIVLRHLRARARHGHDARRHGVDGDDTAALPRVGLRLRRGHGARVTSDRKGQGTAHVIVSVPIRVDAERADLNAGRHILFTLGDEGSEIHVLDRHRRRLIKVAAATGRVRLGHARDVHTQHAQGRARRHAHAHATGGNHLVTQIRPLSPAHAVLDHAERRLRLIVDHRVPRAQEATASILVVIRRQREPPVLVGPLLAHQVGDLLAHQRGVGRLDERGDATHVRGSNRRPRHIPVVRRDHQVRERRVDVPPRRSKTDAHEAIVGGVRSLQSRPERLRARSRHLERAHHGDAPDHRGHHRGPLDVAILNRRRVRGRRTVHGRLVEVQAVVPSARQHGQSALLRSVDRAHRGLQARGLLRVVRLPEPPRVHLEGIVDDIDAVVHSPVVGAHEVLRVQAPLVVDGLNRHEGRVRRDTVDTNVVVVGGDDSGDVRAVDIVVTQRLLAHVGDSIDVAGHGPGRIDPARQVGLLGVDTRVDDADGDGRARHLHLGGAPRIHGFGSPVSGRERIRDVRVWHGQARGRRCWRGCWRRAGGRRRGLVRRPLGLGDRGHASRADRVDRDAVFPQDRV